MSWQISPTMFRECMIKMKFLIFGHISAKYCWILLQFVILKLPRPQKTEVPRPRSWSWPQDRDRGPSSGPWTSYSWLPLPPSSLSLHLSTLLVCEMRNAGGAAQTPRKLTAAAAVAVAVGHETAGGRRGVTLDSIVRACFFSRSFVHLTRAGCSRRTLLLLLLLLSIFLFSPLLHTE